MKVIKKYAKFIVAVIGVVVIALSDFAGISVPFVPEQIYDTLVVVISAFAVRQVPNAG